MEHWMAAIFLMASLTDMTRNYCPDECLAPGDATSQIVLQGAALQYQEVIEGHELYLGYGLDHRYGPFQPTFGASVTDSGDIWIGAGAAWEHHLADFPLTLEAELLPGVWIAGDGPDLGDSALQFRARVGVAYTFEAGHQISLGYDHRSNGNISFPNPGLETISLRVSIALD